VSSSVSPMRSIASAFLLLFGVITVMSAQAQERPSEKAVKGVELYSWKNPSGDWVFALLPGTNRLKTESEIQNWRNVIPNIAVLEKRFSRLAVGEQVFWFNAAELKGLAFPDDKMMDEVGSAAKRANIELHVPPKNERKG